ncbi:MAG: AlpA family transcriptional regulator [Undibacterium sp.]|nr:AlpA family transcriptional regulator [Undibacterium sp.]
MYRHLPKEVNQFTFASSSHHPQTRIIRKDVVLDRLAISNSTLHNFIKRNEFPPPIRLGGGRAVGWLEHEVDAWIEERVAASRNTLACHLSGDK